MDVASNPAPIALPDVTALTGAAPKKELTITPCGYMVLVSPLQVRDRSKGGVYIPDQVREREANLAYVGEVLDLGPDAYKDEDKFPSGARCKVGDYVLFGRYTGSKVSLKEGDLRLLNDDEVLAVVNDPEPFLI